MQQEKIVETKTCKHCNTSFEITDKNLEFYEKISPIFSGKKYNIPTPSLCPDCRQQRRLSYRIERKLYKRKCDITGKNLVSMYSPDKKDIVYDYDYWWSDKWDAMDYGKDFDFSRGFFEQIYELSQKVPKAHIEISPSENSEYTNQAGYNKNCYLIFEAGYNENSLYSNNIWNSTNTLDCLFVNEIHNCYECINVEKSYNVMFSQKTYNCKNSMYLYDCNNCEYCIGCWNLNGKKYYILNQEKSKEEFEEIYKKIKEDKKYKEEFLLELENKKAGNLINKNINNILSENVNGDYIIESKNCSGFNIRNSENCNYSTNIYSSNNCMDFCYWGNGANYVLDSNCVGNNINKVIFSYMCYNNIDNITYCMNCINNCSNLFGCIGLKNKSYCILNKQYTKEEYEELVPKIIEHIKNIGEWGEFFPSWMSPFGYNETVAQEYYPIPHPDSLLRGEGERFKWSDYEPPFPKVEKIIPANKLPYNIADIPDDILNWAIECEVTKKPFRIIAQELEFYRKHNLPIPRRHPDQRHLDRMALRNPRKLFDRKCDKCGKDMKTTYNPERKEIVYCEECYNREVY